jgi:hypothetical protein
LLYLLDTNKPNQTLADDLAVPVEQIGQLLTPLTRFTNKGGTFAIDNGAFSRFDAKAFFSLLEREKPNRDRCKFVVAPDVVGSARRTGELFHHFYPKLHGWKIALACQDGQEDLPIDWNLIDAVFIGGTDKFKVSDGARQIVKAAQALGKWTHMGRVNSAERILLAEEWGIDSIDGTGLARFAEYRRKVADKRDAPRFDFDDLVPLLKGD